MATTPKSNPPPEPPRHPAQPPPVQPGVPQPDQQPKPPDDKEEDEPEEKVLDKDEAQRLFAAGHRLKKKGDAAEKWIAATRLHGQLCIAKPLDDEAKKELEQQELVLLPD